MGITKFRRLFQASKRPDDASSVRASWIVDGDEAALIDPAGGRLLAYVHHDGYGKYYPTLTVSIVQAVRILRCEPARLVSVRSFPRMTVELFRIKTDSIAAALKQVESCVGG